MRVNVEITVVKGRRFRRETMLVERGVVFE